MGLDIYFYKTYYKGNDHREALSQRGREIAYFRKANFIYGYAETKGLLNETGTIGLFTKKDLSDLVAMCEYVNKNREEAEKTLPVCDGFFFGSQEYGEVYFYWIQEVINLVGPVADEISEDERIVVYFWY